MKEYQSQSKNEYFKKEIRKRRIKKIFNIISIIILVPIISIFIYLKIDSSNVNLDGTKKEKIRDIKNGTYDKLTAYNQYNKKADFIINNKRDQDIYLILQDVRTNKKAIGIYVYNDTTIKTKVPLGEYEIYSYSGDSWINNKEKFGIFTYEEKIEEKFKFYEIKEKDGYTTMGNGITLSYNYGYGKNKVKKLLKGLF